MATLLTDPRAVRPTPALPPLAGGPGSLRWQIVGLIERFGRPLRDGAVLAGLMFMAYLFVITAPSTGTVGFDAFAYWSVNLQDVYGTAQGAYTFGVFRYSPVAAQLMAPFALLPFWQFLWLWLALLVGTLVWLGGRRTLVLLAFPPVALELYHGNIHILLAAAIVLGFRYPAAWSFVILNKVTPGVGLVWFAARREWRSLGIALAVTAVIASVSAVIAPNLWLEWFASLTRTADLDTAGRSALAIPLLLRVPLAAILIAWGARTDRRWTVPVGATLAMPVLWPSAFATLVAVVPILRARAADRATGMRRTPQAAVTLPGGV